MTRIRTGAGLTPRDLRRLRRAGYAIQAIETQHLEQSEDTEIIWEREDGPDAITAAEVPF
jgi:hypothetical protein